MAPFKKALDVVYRSTRPDGTKVYGGHVDREWTVVAVPNGGYVLALIVAACLKQQASTNHPDLIHVTAHYLQATSIAPFEVHVRVVKTGRGFSNLQADLIQSDRIKIMTHMIFGVQTTSPNDPGPPLTLKPPSKYARRIPLHLHPATVQPTKMGERYTFRNRVKWSKDPVIHERNHPESATRTDSESVGGGGIEWGAWCEFTDEEDDLTTPSLAFLADIFENIIAVLPRGERAGVGESWFPTMTMAIEFKSPTPKSPDHSSRTAGIYSSARFVNDPQGRHDAWVEVWTAPSEIGHGEVVSGWRDKQVCLAVGTQMALTLPVEVNRARNKQTDAKL